MLDTSAGTMTFLFGEVCGRHTPEKHSSSSLQQALARYQTLFADEVRTGGGRMLLPDFDGIRFFATFPFAADAVSTACRIQQAFTAGSWSEGVALRLALFTGDSEGTADGYLTAGGRICARLGAMAHGGQTLLSATTAEVAGPALSSEVRLRPVGTCRLIACTPPEPVYGLEAPHLPDNFPPLNALHTPPHNLPIQRSRFIARSREMAEVTRLLRAAGLVSLTGAGGCGKTRLALQVADMMLEEFPDGVWFSDLAVLHDPALLSHTVGVNLGLHGAGSGDSSPYAGLANAIGSRRLLLVLDNCEHLVAACAALAHHLLQVCPHLRILTTSREPLNVPGEITWRVPSLGTPNPRWRLAPEVVSRYPSVQLFLDRAIAAVPSFVISAENASAIAQICYQLDGIPLAIELAAARIKVLTAQQISDRLEACFDLLTGGSRTALPRHQTLWALVDWSHSLMSVPEQLLWRRLSVFRGGFSLAAAEAVCSGDVLTAGMILDLLAQLVEKSQVLVAEQNGEGRYRLLETIRQYGAERLRRAGEADSVQRRHRDWFLSLAEQAEATMSAPHESVWFDRLERDHDNLMVALEWSKEHGEVQIGLRLASSLEWYWSLRGYGREGRKQLAVLLALPMPVDGAVRSKALFAAGCLAYVQGDTDEALALLQESLALARAAEDGRLVATTLVWLGVAARAVGEYERAEALSVDSLELSRRLADKPLMATALYYLAVIARLRKNYTRAQVLYQEALGLRREQGSKHGVAECLRGLADLAREAGDYPRAATLYRESLVLTGELGDKQCSIGSLEGLAWVAGAQGHWERAAMLFGAAEGLREATGHRSAPARRTELEAGRSAAHAALGETAFAAALGKGQVMDLKQVVANDSAQEAEGKNTPPSPSRPAPGPLTEREVEVVRLVGRGLTDREVAERLFISPRTVDHHLRHIFNKLGISNRTALAAYALRQGLLD